MTSGQVRALCELLRIRWECLRTRTKERAYLMMEKLVTSEPFTFFCNPSPFFCTPDEEIMLFSAMSITGALKPRLVIEQVSLE